MFTNLQQSAKSILAKIILFFLVAMFGLWGVGDVFRSFGGGPVNVATVGKTPITLQEYQNSMHRTHQQPEQVLGGLVNDLLIEKEAAATGIVVDDDEVADFINNLAEFKGKDGQFDKALYDQMLMSAGMSEHRFVEDIRHEIAAKLLLAPFTAGAQVPESLVVALCKMQEEQRNAHLIVLPASAIVSRVAAPTDKEIKAYYDAHPKSFMAPEYRTVSYVTLPLADIQSKVDVPDDEIKRVYEERKDDFRQPERREVEDLQFDNEQDAKEASAKLAKGADFAKVKAASPIENKDKTSLGPVTGQDLPQGAAKAVFALKENETTPPTMADYRWHIYHVNKIMPEHADTLDEAHKPIAAEIASREAQETSMKLVNVLEDAMAGGASFEQAAEKVGQKMHTVGPVTHDGMLADGKKADLPPYDNFINVAFSTPEKDHSQAVQAADGSYFLVRVDTVAPEHVKPLSEVKAQVTAAALAEKTEAELQKTAQAIYDKLHAGKNQDDAIVAIGVSVKPELSGNLKRASESVSQGALRKQVLPHIMVAELFHIRVGESTHPYPTGDGNYVIATLDQIIPAPAKPDPKVLDKIRESLGDTLTNESMHDYLNYLRSKYPVTVNSAALNVKDEAGGE